MMPRRISIFLLLLLFGSLSFLHAQTTMKLQGRIVDKKTQEPVIGAAVTLKETEQWTISNKEGNFEFQDVLPKEYTIQVKCLCYELYSSVVKAYPGAAISILLVPIAYDMEEVNVTAKKGSNISTSTTIGNAAIEHVQATGLNDIMQLLPGNIAENPDFSGPQQISIREIGTDDNTALGTSILIDNAPLSNDANMQTLSTSVSNEGEFNTVVGSGLDLRQISSDNIESVEVIKGIPSVVHGEMTSGAVLVSTKAGYSPFSIRLKSDPKIKQMALGKGFKIPSSSAFLNFNLDYLSSFTDVISKYEGYKRLTAQTAYSNTFMKESYPLSFNAKLNVFGTIDNTKTDPDAMVAEEEYESKDKGIRLNLNGRWSLNKKLVSSIRYTFSTSYTHQESYQKRYRTTSGGVTPVSLSLTEGENEGLYLPTEQLTEMTIDGKPVNIFGQVTLTKLMNFEKGLINKILAGGEYRLNGNFGEGQLYDISNPPFISSHSSRPRSFKDIPSMQTYSLYLEDKAIIPLGSTKLNIQGGIRLNNYQPEAVVKSQMGYYLEPRLNIRYDLLNTNNNKVFKLLTLNAGIGKTYKAPSLVYLYPDLAYYDLTVLDYYTGDPETQMSVFNTMIYSTENPDLKPYENLKKEIGLDFRIATVSGNITAFHEELSNGFQFRSTYEFIDGYRYVADSIPAGEKPDLSTLPVTYYDYIISYRSPVNSKKTIKSGIEFSFNFGKIKALYTSFNLDGAYFKTSRIYSTTEYEYLPSSSSPVQYPNIGVYPAGESKVSERFNTNLRMVTQIPRLRLILSTTMQITWLDKYYYPFYDEAPIYLFDKDGNITEYTDEMRTDPDFKGYYNSKSEFYYLTEVLPPLFLANIRLSKEIEDKMTLSFFVNNFLNYRPMHQYIRSESYIRRNPSIYFGAEVIIKI